MSSEVCTTCGVQIADEDIEAGYAVRIGTKRIYCPDCVPEWKRRSKNKEPSKKTEAARRVAEKLRKQREKAKAESAAKLPAQEEQPAQAEQPVKAAAEPEPPAEKPSPEEPKQEQAQQTQQLQQELQAQLKQVQQLQQQLKQQIQKQEQQPKPSQQPQQTQQQQQPVQQQAQPQQQSPQQPPQQQQQVAQPMPPQAPQPVQQPQQQPVQQPPQQQQQIAQPIQPQAPQPVQQPQQMAQQPPQQQMPQQFAQQPQMQVQQWACHVCGQVIMPLGNPGRVDINGEHYCNNCADVAVVSTLPDTRGSEPNAGPARRSSGGLRAQRGPGSRRTTRMATPSRMPGRSGNSAAQVLNWVKPIVMLAILGIGGYFIVTKVLAKKPEVPEPEDVKKAEEKDTKRGAKKSASKPEKKSQPKKKASSPSNKRGAGTTATKTAPTKTATTKTATKQDPGSTTNPNQPPPPPPPPPPSAAVDEANLTKGLEEAAKLVEDTHLGNARNLLRQLRERHDGKAWWEKHKEGWEKAFKAMKQQLDEFEEEAADGRELLQNKPSSEIIERIAEFWQPYEKSKDSTIGEMARQILHEASRARVAILEKTRAERFQDIENKLVDYEKLMKSRSSSRQQQEMLDYLNKIDEEILANPEWQKTLAPRVIGLRFDVRRKLDGDLVLYHAITRRRGNSAELLYNFDTLSQFKAWSFSQPNAQDKTNTAMWDPVSKSAVLRISGSHDWKGKERQGMPFLKLPMEFLSWSVEADIEVREFGDTEMSADVGMLVWEGGTNVVLFGFREVTDKKGNKAWSFDADGCIAGNDKFEKKFGRTPVPKDGKDKKVKMFVSFVNGALIYGAGLGSRPLGKQQRISMPFKPNFLGLYIRTRGGGTTVASFDNIKIMGLPDTKSLKIKVDVARSIEMSTAGDEWRKQAQAARTARDEAAGLIPKDWHAQWECAAAQPCTQAADRPNARQTAITNPATMPVWSRKIKLAPYKTHYVHADLSAPRDATWEVAVLVNHKQISSQIVTGPLWQMMDVDISKFGGQEVLVQVSHRPTGEQGDKTAYWDRMYIGSK